MLTNAPTGAPWSSIPLPNASGPAQLAEQTNICWRSTNMVDAICNQPLRATSNTERVQGPGDWRLTVDASGVARAIMSRWPVTQVVGARVSARAAFPRAWTTIPLTAVDLEDPPMGAYGTTVEGAAGAGGHAVLVAPGYVNWFGGRLGYILELAYLNGWAHTSLTAAANAGANAFPVDDVTAFTGAAAFVYDGANTETVTVQSVAANNPVALPTGGVVQTGPGTVTLTGTTAFSHMAGVVLSALPQDISWAAIMLATTQVLESGSEAIVVQSINGEEMHGGKGVEDLKVEAEVLLAPYRRVI